MTRSIRQGGIELPWCLNLVIKTILAQDKHKWDECGLELRWADSLIFISRTLGDAP